MGNERGYCRLRLLVGLVVVGLAALPAWSIDCRVKIDRSINCDPIVQTDFGFEPVDGQVIDACMTPCDEDIKFKLRVDNGGEMPLTNCVLTDTNAFVLPEPLFVGTVNPGPGVFREIIGPKACAEGADAGEPGTLMVTCDCIDSAGNEIEVSATDSAQFTCAGCQGGGGGDPSVMIMEVCEPQMNGTNKIVATVENNGDLELTDCVVTARVYEGDGDCPGAGPATEVGQEVIPSLDLGESAEVMFEVDGLTADSCSEVDVVCQSGGGEAFDVADDVCEVGDGCLTRTPGFWGEHPHITALYVPVESCGLTVDTADASVAVSATEDMCVDNGEARAARTSPQQLSLIRACTAAALNIAASASEGGNCEADYPGISAAIAECCDGLCNSGSSGNTISESGCIEQIDSFNNSMDTMEAFGPFISPGPANPGPCKEAQGNRFVNPGRNLGPRK